MDHFQSEIQQIKEVLKNSNQGMSITEIARAIKKNNHSVGRYLDNLLVSGQVEMHTYGKAKVFSLSNRVPLETMMGFADDLIIVFDQDNRIVRINNPVLSFFGKSRDEFIGKNLQFLTFPEFWITGFFEKIRISFATRTFDDEICIPGNGGLIFRQKIIPTVFEDGKKGMTILLEDITARKKADSALRISEEQFRLMADNIQDGLIINEGKKTVYMNRRAEEIFGYTHDEISSLTPIDLAIPEERDHIRSIISDTQKSGSVPSDITFWIQRKDGIRRYISSRITSVKHPTIVTYYNIITDMTEWKHAQDALENQLGFLQHMINTFPNPLFYLDIKGRYLGCNSAFCRIIGKSVDEIAGKTNDQLLLQNNTKVFGEHNTELLTGPGVLTYSGIFHHPDNQIYKILIQKSSLIATDGTLVGVVGLVLAMNRSEDNAMDH
jgi:PAS domain S-box-containing protein